MKIILFIVLSCLCTSAFAQSFPSLSTPLKIGGGEKDAAVIIAIEDYAFLPDIKGAEQNGIDWYRQFTRGFNMDPTRVTFLRNEEATKEEIHDAIQKLASQKKKGGRLWFIFIGHGAPHPGGKGGVLVGVDTQQNAKSISARGVLQKDIFKPLERATRGRKQQAVVLIDACFSGTSGGKVLVPGLQPVLVMKKIKSSLIFLFAAQNNQYAGPLPDLSRPAYSYLALGALRGWADDNNDKKVSVKELTNYVNDSMMILIKGRRQTAGQFAPRLKETLTGKVTEKSPDWTDFLLGNRSLVVISERTPVIVPKTEVSGQRKTTVKTSGSTKFKEAKRFCEEEKQEDIYRGTSCLSVGQAFQLGLWGKKKEKYLSDKFFRKAAVLFDRSCRSENAIGCFYFSGMFRHGMSVKKDAHRASKLMSKSCDLKNANACIMVSMEIKDEKKSLLLLEKGCRLDTATCGFLATKYLRKDKKKAIFYLEKACKGYIKTFGLAECPQAEQIEKLKR